MNKLTLIIFLIFNATTFLCASPEINARTAILIDFNSNKTIYELNPDKVIYPASMTKIMTSIIAFDLLKDKKISLDDKYIVSEKAWRMSQSGYSSMFIMINDQISVDDLLKGIIIASGNDACVTLAEGIAGTEENFVEMMNEKAEELGMTNTTFGNSSGIDGVSNLSTVRDIALMSKYLIKEHPDFYKLYAEKTFTWDRTGGESIKQFNRNTLINKGIGVDGIKTGFLSLEKYSLASSMKKESRRLIAVGSGFETKKLRVSQSLKLLSWGFRNSDTYEVAKKNETSFEVRTWLGKENNVKVTTKENIYITLNKKDSRTYKVILDYKGPVIAPIKKNDQIATINIFVNNKKVKTAPLYAVDNVKKINFLKSLFTSMNYLIWGDV